jgi:hypothetical protein
MVMEVQVSTNVSDQLGLCQVNWDRTVPPEARQDVGAEAGDGGDRDFSFT